MIAALALLVGGAGTVSAVPGGTPGSDSGGAGGAAGNGRVGSGRLDGGGYWLRAEGTFAPPSAFVPSPAKTYDMRLVPAAARIEIGQFSVDTGTTVTARLRGLVPGRAYGMHVHTAPCGSDPKDAGPHYQHRPSPTAEPGNEVWLDFRTDANGEGSARARHGWGFRPGGAGSVVIHDAPGGAGARLACFTVPFGSYGAL
ncbi:superoxide dismutase family protein [Streptomyces sp. DT24]|uniref:superoxide dismutase family protein n=1 Tax=Streptomyces sp. DT24 TaxID=3416520 RepID=UPI003CFA41CF